MSAFGRRGGASGTGGRPSFGVARPMKGGGKATALPVEGGEQFPPLDNIDFDGEDIVPGSMDRGDAMSRLTERQAAPNETSAPA